MLVVWITLIYVHFIMAAPNSRASERSSNQLAVEIRYFLSFREFLTEANNLCGVESAELKGKVQASLYTTQRCTLVQRFIYVIKNYMLFFCSIQRLRTCLLMSGDRIGPIWICQRNSLNHG